MDTTVLRNLVNARNSLRDVVNVQLTECEDYTGLDKFALDMDARLVKSIVKEAARLLKECK